MKILAYFNSGNDYWYDKNINEIEWIDRNAYIIKKKDYNYYLTY